MPDPESIILRYDPVGGASRCIVIEPRVDGAYVLEETWIGGRWHTIGTEVAEAVAIEGVGEAPVRVDE